MEGILRRFNGVDGSIFRKIVSSWLCFLSSIFWKMIGFEVRLVVTIFRKIVKHWRWINRFDALTYREKVSFSKLLPFLTIYSVIVFLICLTSLIGFRHKMSVEPADISTIISRCGYIGKSVPETGEIAKDSFPSFVEIEDPEVATTIATNDSEAIPAFMQATYSLPERLWLHFEPGYEDVQFSWIPQVLEAPISAEDIRIDLDDIIKPEFGGKVSDEDRRLICLVVAREIGYQPRLGQLLTAEGVIGRIRTDDTWDDIYPTLEQAYDVIKHKDGTVHVYLDWHYEPLIDSETGEPVLDSETGEPVLIIVGTEITDYSRSVKQAVDLALSGSSVSSLLLEIVTEKVNEMYGLELGESYYSQGTQFHYGPNGLGPYEASLRTINQVPVSFQVVDQIFYGMWLHESQKLAIELPCLNPKVEG